jgi:ABC-type Mn2+/Zn2+ transport system permease subunit
MSLTTDFYHIFLALILGSFIGALAGYIGSLMATKSMSLVGGALGHLALPGISLALLFNFDVSLGALLFLIFGIVIIWSLNNITHLPFEILTAVVFAVSLAASFLIMPQKDIDIALLGNIAHLSPIVVIISCLVSLVTFVCIQKIYAKIILITISEDLAKVNKISVKLVNFIYLTSIGLTVALGVRIIGGLMVAALVSIPAATSYNISKDLYTYSYFSALFGALSCMLGILVHSYLGYPVGPCIILANGSFFIASVYFKKGNYE